MSQSLKRDVEDWSIAAVTDGGGVGGIQLVHQSDTEQAQMERLIFDAKAGGKSSDGPKAFDVELKIELRSTNLDAEAVDAIFASVEEDMSQYLASDVATGLFSVLIPQPWRQSSESSDVHNTRHRETSYYFDVLPSYGVFLPSGDLAFVPPGDLMFA